MGYNCVLSQEFSNLSFPKRILWEHQRLMTKKATGKQGETRQKQHVLPDLRALLKVLYRRGIAGVLLISLAIVTFLGLISPETSGVLLAWWSGFLLWAFGWGSYVVALTIAGLGGLWAAGQVPDRKRIPWHAIVGIEIIVLALLGLTHLLFARTDPWQAAKAGGGGGVVGAVFSGIFVETLGPLPAGLVLGMVLVFGVIVVLGLTVQEAMERTEEWAINTWQ